MSHKAPSCILFDKNKQYHSFGYEAETKYNQLVQEGDHYEWYFFTTFKMLLYQAQVMFFAFHIFDLKNTVDIGHGHGDRGLFYQLQNGPASNSDQVSAIYESLYSNSVTQ